MLHRTLYRNSDNTSKSPNVFRHWFATSKINITLLARMALGLVFIFAGTDKIFNPHAFAKIIINYQILPGFLINSTAIILPWLELILGLLLIFGLWLPGAVLLTNVLLAAFFGMLVFNTARGLNVHCGCFSTSAQGNVHMAWYLVRDGLFLLLGGYLFVRIVIRGPS